MCERPLKIVEIGYLHILLAGYLVSVLCIKADLHYTTFALCNVLVQLELYWVKHQAHKLTLAFTCLRCHSHTAHSYVLGSRSTLKLYTYI